MRLLICLAALLILAGVLPAQEYQLVQDEVRIPRGQSRSFEFTTVPQKDHTILLDIMARLDSDGLGGSLYFMKLTLNGHVVQAAKTRTAVRLLNKKLVSPVAPNLPYSWSDNQAWRILYSPDFEKALNSGYYEGNPYQTVLDVTDLTNPAAENRLEIANVCGYKPPEGAKGNHDLVIKTLAVRVQDGASPMMTANGTDRAVINRGTPGAGPAKYQGKLLPGGGFSLTTGGHTLQFSAAVSYPNAGLNHLLAGDSDSARYAAQPGWRLDVKPTADGGAVIGEGPDYRLERTVRFTPRRVEVSDKLINKHADAKLGLLVENTVNIKDLPAAVRLAGNPDPAINAYYSQGNPSVYVALKDVGLGMICEDDIYRNQATLFCDGDTGRAGLRTSRLCLAPGGSVTLQWSVYPVASVDYYDFINLVRQDWGSNYTVEGAWTFFDPDSIIAMTVDDIRAKFTRLGIKRACYCGGWVDRKHDRKRIGFGTGVFDDYWADFRDRLRQAADKIHQAVPDCKVYVYYDTQRDTSEGGEERFKDSWLSDPKGNQYTTEWGGVYSLTRSVVATLENSYGKAMLGLVDRYLKEMKIDGLYWDEMEGVGYGSPLLTYNVWDGYSCDLDPKTYTIARECAINTIVGEAHRIAVIKRVRELGGDMMGNGPTATKDILALKPQRMIEIQHNEYWNYEGNLDSPLGYGSSPMGFDNWIRALKMGTLIVGTRYTYTHEISPYVFPFTPIELHAGYLLGKERIITLHDGKYGWPGDKSLVQVRVFNKEGLLTDRDFSTKIAAEARTAVQVPENEAVVLVRVPAVLIPKKSEATVSKLDYGVTGLKCTVQAPQGATLELRPGEFPFTPNAKLVWLLNGNERPLTVDAKGVARVAIPATTTGKAAEVIVTVGQ
ncbi:MAG: hypothetical protein KKI08_05625 [Armatimonadetes bacterium]|nr:hypothetical protein [Armatimonadota bacterium]